MKVKTVPASEAAYILRSKLGAVRAWDDMLADMRRGKSTYFGLVLIPYLCSHDGKGSRPYYSLVDIADFIGAVLAVAPPSPATISLQVREFEVDPTDKRSWKVRVLP
ncbi:hypothetical protein [Pseudomonas sp. NPDC089396]|uniref:hypothetical protein n=1 Tax=Pseudomonas sp. NPDC089396 TaxID=3364461 RepID=UPI003832D1FF